jgi:hypothetical protein
MTLPSVSAIGEHGPLKTHPLAFPLDSLTALIVDAAYHWAIHSGFHTDEVAQPEETA